MNREKNPASKNIEVVKLNKNEVLTQSEKLINKLDRKQKLDNRRERLENAHNDLEKQFRDQIQGNKIKPPVKNSQKNTPTPAPIIKKADKKTKRAIYNQTLNDIRSEMSAGEKTFSKVIHNPIIEKVSSAAGATIARPAALILGSLSALIFVTIIYTMAKYYGWALSGSEWMAAFVAGWCVGLIIDWVRITIFGKRAGPA